ncbi:twin arginine-targeting protein translocase TatC [Niabella ginsenosidivorans]|uniref:Sec-independent protein translocase protein TatC n=1 Tax=Niabella ginsenosidivorans TaxID=1176587 RepID=A0A1A9HWI0_9BACT|nr:twin-arginine translocase subunit TatC [Niabella ginsenosidivorans]ANH79593.1 twin arginine-targeting protein translocase TatC [Niabella ginsenosidivorans]
MALLDFLKKRGGDSDEEMSFIDHLEVLRWHLIRSIIAIVICAILIFIYINEIVDVIIMAPTKPNFIAAKWFCWLGQKLHIDSLCLNASDVHFQETAMTGQFISSFTIAFVGGFIVAFPYVFWELWKFVRPALSDKERRQTSGIIFWVAVLFFIGVLFGYFILTPFMVNFYFNYKLSSQIAIVPLFSDYLENLIYTTAGIGLLFQMPLLVLLLAKIGIVTAKFLRKYRRHAFVVIITAAAIITPSTDPFSLMIVTIPLYLLYEASISVAAKVQKADKEQAEEWS